MHRWTPWLLATVLAVSGLSCKHTCCKKSPAPCSTCPPPGGALIQPQPLLPGPGAGPAPSPEVLQPAPPPPGASAAPGAPPLNPTPAGYPPIARGYGPVPAVHLLQPELSESIQQAAASEPAAPESKSVPSPTLPVGIPGFAPAIAEKVANGRKPALEGLDWLKANGYRGALLVRKPGENDAADRRQFEARGLNFTSLEVALASLDRSTVEQFNYAVTNAARQPLFVYDADGSLTGLLWYLYFRRAEHVDDDAARTKAERLGLKLGERDQRLGWLAVQDFLAKNP
jgi:hypothetical protein